MNEGYSIQKHTHNFAVWAAARASQRGFVKTIYVREAIASTNLRLLAEGKLHPPKMKMPSNSFTKSVAEKLYPFSN